MPPSAITGTPGLRRLVGAAQHGGELGHADAGDDAGRADGPRADPHLDGVRPGVDEPPGALARGDVAADDRHPERRA